MTQDKELLLKDLCARLPYGVKMNHIADDEHSPKTLIGVAKDMITLEGLGGYECVDIEHYKPYLFPLSNMTDEQNSELLNIVKYCEIELKDNDAEFWSLIMDFYNKHHIDYRCLIERGLAIDATGKNIY
jgi:hypothetical protein